MVRIVDDFWENYHTYEENIISSILDIVRKQFPNPDPQGEKEDINFVITELHRLNIFGKFDTKRLKSETRTTRQQFENFLYQRIWAILWNEYGRRRKRIIRFKRVACAEQYNKTTWRRPPEEDIYDNGYLRDHKSNPNPNEEERLQHMRASKQPTIHDIGEVCSVTEETDQATEINEVLTFVLNACKNERERQVIQLRQEGLHNSEIGDTLNISGSNVGAILNRIKKRYKELVA